MASKAIRSLKTITDKIRKSLGDVVSRKEMLEIGDFAVDLIVKRTRLGYGVSKQFGTKMRLKSLSESYKKRRAKFAGLSGTTTPSRSNLTLTGQMLESMDVITARDGRVTFGPTGYRSSDGNSNLEIAEYQEEAGRIFNRVSQLEFQQIVRFYRKRFGDLLKKRNLLR